jgi:hypothetical protein
MRFKEILGRLTGLSSPIFGVSWNPPEPDVTVARRVVAFLEDRRVLYVPSEMEVPEHCVRSVLEIRRFLTTELQSLDSSADLAASLRALRAACRKFMDVVGARSEIVTFGAHRGHWASWEFNGASGNCGVSSESTLPGWRARTDLMLRATSRASSPRRPRTTPPRMGRHEWIERPQNKAMHQSRRGVEDAPRGPQLHLCAPRR